MPLFSTYRWKNNYEKKYFLTYPIYKKIKIFFISWKMLFIKSFPKSHVLLKLMVTRIFKCGNCHGIFTQFFFIKVTS